MPDTLVTFFKALADKNRLRIVGLLAQQERGVDELAAALDLRASTVSHHLSKLAEAGLVSSRTEGHFHLYSLDEAAIEANARRLLARGELRELAGPLKRYSDDTATLRRGLVDHRILAREAGGARYWRIA